MGFGDLVLFFVVMIMRLIDADELKKKLEAEHCDCEIMAMIDDMLTAVEATNTLAAQIMEHYGEEHQQLKLCEECGELIQAAIKAHEIGADITTDFVGELADVYVLINQFIATMPTVWRTEFDTMVMFKLRRQIERIENEVS